MILHLYRLQGFQRFHGFQAFQRFRSIGVPRVPAGASNGAVDLAPFVPWMSYAYVVVPLPLRLSLRLPSATAGVGSVRAGLA
jgi:hypothetical protein